MSSATQISRGSQGPLAFLDNGISSFVLRLIGLTVVNGFSIWFLAQLLRDDQWPLGIVVAIIALGLNLFYVRPDLYPFRWFSPGLVLMVLMIAYPAVTTILVAFTNYSDGNLLTKTQAVRLLEQRTYAPEDSTTYSWTAFQNESGEFALWLQEEDGSSFLAYPDEALIPAAEAGLDLDEDAIPHGIEGYTRLERADLIRALATLDTVEFGIDPAVRVTGRSEAQELVQRYTFDSAENQILDQETGAIYRPIRGTFTAEDGDELIPGYFVPIGLDNFSRLINSSAILGPFARVFAWNVVYAILSVGLQFAAGLGLALVVGHKLVPGGKLLRTIILIPFAVPSFISVQIWRGLLNPEFGMISQAITDLPLIDSTPAWFSDPLWSKVGILFVKMWIGFPYFMLIITGALQSIPQDMHEAAQVDGASSWQRFWRLTFPLLMVAVAPLLMASFAFNFNDFTVIEIWNGGGPPIAGASTPVGHTDILLTYTFSLAFAGGRGADFGFATTISIFIFAVVTAVTVIQFRFTKKLEEFSESG